MHESETRQQFPKMVYLGGVPSGDPSNFRIVNDPQALDAAQAEGFTAYDPATKGQLPAPAPAPEADHEPEQEPEREAAAAPRSRARRIHAPDHNGGE